MISKLTEKVPKEWKTIVVLPNLELQSPIEGGLIALVPFDDQRVHELGKAHPNLRKFLNRFKDAFGEKVYPTVLIVDKSAPKSVLTVEAIASFRDAIAISVVPYNRAHELTSREGMPRIIFSNAFWIYPWMINKDYDDLIANTPSMLAVHEVSKFHGQQSPELFKATLAQSNIDRPLLMAILEHWHSHYVSKKPKKWENRALFRSLNMANQASLMPAGTDMTLYDIGRSLALWVSAFEILTHPGGTGWAGLSTVYDLLEKVVWAIPKSGYCKYKAHNPWNQSKPRRPLACWLYGEIYKARNDFLHGNPISPSRLTFKGSKRNMFNYAAPLYRLALTGFLQLSYSAPVPPLSDGKAFGNYCAELMQFRSYQKNFEKSLFTAKDKK